MVTKIKKGVSIQDLTKIANKSRVLTVVEANKTIAEINEEFTQVREEIGVVSDSIPKTYVALLEQTGTAAPEVLSENKNTIGDIVWTRFAAGRFRGTLAGAFDELTTRVYPHLWVKYVDSEILAYVFSITSDYIEIDVTEETATTLVDGFRMDIRIEVYPELAE